MQRSQLGVLVLLTAFIALAGCSRVQADWKSAQAADTAAAYEQFLTEHPDSAFSPQARLRLKQFAEDRDWQQASTADTLDAYEQFVAQHADGKWAQEARVRIENLQLQSTDGAAAAGSVAATPAVPGSTPAAAAVPAVPAAAAAAATAKPAAPAAKPAASASKPAVAAAKPASKPASAASIASGAWAAQLGAFSSKAHAESAWQQLRRKFPAQLGSLNPSYQSAGSGARHVYRLQVATGSEQKARELCGKLKSKSQACVPAHR